MFTKKVIPVSLLLSLCFSLSVYADGGSSAASLTSRKGPNMSVNSEDLEPYDINKDSDPDEKPVFYADDKMVVGINENSEPNVGMRF